MSTCRCLFFLNNEMVNVELVSSVAVILLTVVSVFLLSRIYLAHSLPPSRNTATPHSEL